MTVIGMLPLAVTGLVAAPVDFEADIEPILKERCFKCHGDEKQKGKLRLDRLAGMLRGGDSGEAAVVPGDPAGSFLVKLVKHEEADLEMPPKGGPLTAAQIELISKWITEGAKTPDRYGPAEEKVDLTHWSFQPLTRPDTADGIDGFIRRKLAANTLNPSPEADRRTLIRRLYLVMLGVPPSPDAVEAFVGDRRSDAWPRLVDSVLANPQYGERWASHWLDIARFGETHGFEMNRERPHAWRYRDWVIDSLNADKPYDQFVKEQIAGDALGAPMGTAFLVAGPVDQVKGQDPKLRQMQRMNELDDIINTTGTAFLGLTTGCARCHNHKFDPISQKDYYAMQAVFAGVRHGNRKLELSDAQRQEREAMNKQIAALTKDLQEFVRPATGSIVAVTDAPPSLLPPVNARHNVEHFSPRKAKFVRFTIGKTNGAQACIDELEIFAAGKNVALASTGAKTSSNGDFKHPLHKLEHINDGKYGNPKSWIAAKGTGWVQIELPAVTEIERIEWGRDREGKLGDRLAIDYRIETAVEPGKWTFLCGSQGRFPFKANSKTPPTPLYSFEGLPEAEATRGRMLLEQLEAAQKRSDAIKPAEAYTGTFSQPGATHRLYRGEPDQKRERVGPDGIAVLATLGLDLEAPEQQRRLAFAHWVGSPDNPLTARVIVNRLWQFQFGIGIVDTPSDFGVSGTPPSHPLLLDWLASELVANDWSLKHMHRLILNSATWRQDSKPVTAGMRVDAASRLLWRFPSRRLEAEGIRDSILAATGVLDTGKLGGPGFSPFEVHMENVRHYHAKKTYGPADWRRMIYMTKVRQEREQVFGAFDCPDASMAVAKRSRSTTPLQALNLLNSSFVLQQAKLFAKRLENEAAADSARIARAWQLCFQRPPTRGEVAESADFIASHGLMQFCRAMLNANEFVFIP
jgi:hypothetical protein